MFLFRAFVLGILLQTTFGTPLQYFYEHAKLGDLPELDNEIYTNANLTVPEIIAKYGYPVEVHHVTTEDGYILELHRIPYGRVCGPHQGKQVVLVQHGLLCDSSNFVISGVNRSLAFILADNCFDVWLGNSRGNRYSRNHTTLHPFRDRDAFWNFSWNEMGTYDLPAVFDYVLAETKAGKLHYIGHSMGTTMYWVCMTERPEYNDKVALMTALAPVAFTQNMISPIRFIAPFSNNIERVLELLGLHEFLPSNPIWDIVGNIFCDPSKPFHEVCANFLFLLCGFDPEQYDPELTQEIIGQLPAGTSVRTVVHYAQGVVSGRFSKYDFGVERNLELYGSETPPDYDFSKIKTPVAMYWGQNDWLGTPKDTERIRLNLENVQRYFRVDFDKWNHLDFLFAKDVVPLLYEPVIDFMKDKASFGIRKSSWSLGTFLVICLFLFVMK